MYVMHLYFPYLLLKTQIKMTKKTKIKDKLKNWRSIKQKQQNQCKPTFYNFAKKFRQLRDASLLNLMLGDYFLQKLNKMF